MLLLVPHWNLLTWVGLNCDGRIYSKVVWYKAVLCGTEWYGMAWLGMV